MVINVSKKSHFKWDDEMINEAVSLSGDKFFDISPENVPFNANSALINHYVIKLMKQIEAVIKPNQDVVVVDIHDNGLNYKLVNILKGCYPDLTIIYPCYRYTAKGRVFNKFRFY